MLVLISFAVGAPVAYLAMQTWLNDFAYRTDIHPTIFLAVGVAVLAIAALTVGYQAVRTALANPATALRHE